MVLTASDANIFTTNSININNNIDLQHEVDLTERSIRNAASLKKYSIEFNATVIGNPISDPMTDTSLTSLQIAYRDAFVSAGYSVTVNSVSGFWELSWTSSKIESTVSIYSIRTTVTPGAVSAATITEINNFFTNQPTSNFSKTVLIATNGGDILESDIGAANSVFYEYTIIVDQQDKTIDFTSSLVTAMTGAGTIGASLGYTTTNFAIYKIT